MRSVVSEGACLWKSGSRSDSRRSCVRSSDGKSGSSFPGSWGYGRITLSETGDCCNVCGDDPAAAEDAGDSPRKLAFFSSVHPDGHGSLRQKPCRGDRGPAADRQKVCRCTGCRSCERFPEGRSLFCHADQGEGRKAPALPDKGGRSQDQQTSRRSVKKRRDGRSWR